MTTIIAIGGEEIGVLREDGTNRRIAAEVIHKEIIARTAKKHPKVLYIPTAKNDSEAYIAGFKRYYSGLGCREIDVLRLIRHRQSVAEIKAQIMSADLIYVNGGNTHRMMRMWKKRGVVDLLKQAHQNGIVMSGGSAGAICWFKSGDSNSFNKRRPFKATAMGIVNALLCPHYDTEKSRKSSLKRMMKKTPKIVAIALDECAAIEIIDNSYRILSATPKNKARRTYWLKDKYIVEDIKTTDHFQDLDVLLTKPAA